MLKVAAVMMYLIAEIVMAAPKPQQPNKTKAVPVTKVYSEVADVFKMHPADDVKVTVALSNGNGFPIRVTEMRCTWATKWSDRTTAFKAKVNVVLGPYDTVHVTKNMGQEPYWATAAGCKPTKATRGY